MRRGTLAGAARWVVGSEWPVASHAAAKKNRPLTLSLHVVHCPVLGANHGHAPLYIRQITPWRPLPFAELNILHPDVPQQSTLHAVCLPSKALASQQQLCEVCLIKPLSQYPPAPPLLLCGP